jgi:diguanylate cyclase (GGDEF)-like protein
MPPTGDRYVWVVSPVGDAGAKDGWVSGLPMVNERNPLNNSPREQVPPASVRSVFKFVNHLMHPRQKGTILSLIVLLTFVIGFVDYGTGYDLSVALFYLLPVALASWYLGRNTGVLVSLLSAEALLLANAFTPQGKSFPLPLVVWNALSRLGFFLVMVFLLSMLRQALERERALARTDYLTGVWNTRAFQEFANRELERAKRQHLPLTLVYMDLDDFKLVNDGQGHAAGDRLLQEIGRSLMNNLRATDVVGRLGGDEFAILLPDTGYQEAKSVIAKLERTLTTEIQTEGFPVTMSMGAVTCKETLASLEELLRTADHLMYSAKRSGKHGLQHEVWGRNA